VCVCVCVCVVADGSTVDLGHVRAGRELDSLALSPARLDVERAHPGIRRLPAREVDNGAVGGGRVVVLAERLLELAAVLVGHGEGRRRELHGVGRERGVVVIDDGALEDLRARQAPVLQSGPGSRDVHEAECARRER